MGALYNSENPGILRWMHYFKPMFRQRALPFCLLLALAPGALAVGKDWPQWRGPNRDGISTETGLLKEWRSDGPPLAWRTKGLGRGMSSVDIANGRIFTQGAANKNGQRGVFVTALNPADGKEIWSTAITTGREPQPNGTPTIDGQLLFAVGNDGDVACLETETGKLVWKKNFGSDFGGKCMSSWGYNKIANGTADIPTPLVKGDYVFGSSGYGDGGSAPIKLSKAGDGVKAEEVYYLSANQLQNHHGGMILLGDHIYMGHGHNNGFPTCVEFLTGKVVWGKERGPGTGSAAIVYADGHLYFRYQDATMALIEATTKGYKLKSSFQLASKLGESWPHPVILDGKLYVRDQDVLLCYDVRAR